MDYRNKYNLLVLSDINIDKNIPSNSFDYFNHVFDDYLSVSKEGSTKFYEQPLLENTSIFDAPTYRWQENIFGNVKLEVLAIPFILYNNDDVVKYFYVKRNISSGFVEIYIVANKDSIGCSSNRNPLISIFNISGNLKNKSPIVLGLSNSPSECLAIVKNDNKLCNASNLIKAMLKITNYFGIREIKLGDSAGIQCRMDVPVGRNKCGLVFNEKNVPLSIQRRILNKKGFYEEIGFIPEGNYDYDSIFKTIGDSNLQDIISIDDQNTYTDLFDRPSGTVSDFLMNYTNMKALNDGKDLARCKWIEKFLNEIYEGRNIALILIFQNYNMDYPLMMKKYKSQIFKQSD